MRIGLFDSGVGGLTVMAACKRLLPRASFVYYDDAEHAPYGDKSDEEIISAADGCVRALVSAGCDAIVVACNTATAVAVRRLRESCGVPVLGLEPAVAPALRRAASRIILSEKFQVRHVSIISRAARVFFSVPHSAWIFCRSRRRFSCAAQ